jgi:hypothetical protein
MYVHCMVVRPDVNEPMIVHAPRVSKSLVTLLNHQWRNFAMVVICPDNLGPITVLKDADPIQLLHALLGWLRHAALASRIQHAKASGMVYACCTEGKTTGSFHNRSKGTDCLEARARLMQVAVALQSMDTPLLKVSRLAFPTPWLLLRVCSIYASACSIYQKQKWPGNPEQSGHLAHGFSHSMCHALIEHQH